jgi:hypothetical protein
VSDSSALTIDGGGVVTDNDSQIEASALTVEGAGTQLTLNSATITYNGQDTANTSLQILDGGQVKSANQNGFVEFGPAYLTITVDGAGSVLESTGTEEPSDSGLDFFNETTNITNGGLVSSATGLDIGFDGSGVVLNVTGPGSKITAVDELVVGQGGDGLDVSSLGGTLNITRGATAGTTDVNSGITVIGGIEGNGMDFPAEWEALLLTISSLLRDRVSSMSRMAVRWTTCFTWVTPVLPGLSTSMASVPWSMIPVVLVCRSVMPILRPIPLPRGP